MLLYFVVTKFYDLNIMEDNTVCNAGNKEIGTANKLDSKHKLNNFT